MHSRSTDAEIYGIEVVSNYSTFHSDPGLNGAECIATPLNRNFSIIEGVARSETKRSSSIAKGVMCLGLGGRLAL